VSAPLLQVDGLGINYGGMHANKDVDLAVERGRLVGLIGPNGAGKTSFLDAVSGFAPASEGKISFDGTDVTHAPPHRRARAGIGRTFQAVELFDDLTVGENLLVAAEPKRWYTAAVDLVVPRRSREAHERCSEALAAVGLEEVVDWLPSELSNGQRKLVGVARALARRPQLLLLDEPAAGLDTDESLALGKVMRRLVDEGLAILLIDHDMGLVLGVCDEIYVLDFGRLIAHGDPARIKSDPAVITAYLGERAGKEQAEHGDVIAAVQREVREQTEEVRGK
jgi:branched-chain amino acid transport system ATP-binding protein